MARGTKNPDPSLVSEIDLKTFRPILEAIASGAPCPLNVLQIARLCEGVLEQCRGQLPKNHRAGFEKSVRKTIEHAIGLRSIIKGEQLTLLRMHEKGFVNTENGNRHLAEIDFVEAQYERIAATQAARLISEIEKKIATKGTGAGRKLRAFAADSDNDWKLLGDALARLTPERSSIDDWCEEIRRVVIEAAGSGKLPVKGSTPKETIDTHARRLRRQAKKIAGSSPN